LVIHDDADADTDTVTKEAVSAIREVVRHIGKVDLGGISHGSKSVLRNTRRRKSRSAQLPV
jgi:hypothetical protein